MNASQQAPPVAGDPVVAPPRLDEAAEQAGVNVHARDFLPPPPNERPAARSREDVMRLTFGRADAALAEVECTLNLAPFATVGEVLYDLVSDRLRQPMPLSRDDAKHDVQRLAYVRACHVGRAGHIQERNKCAIVGTPPAMLIPRPIAELLLLITNDQGVASGHSYVIQPPKVVEDVVKTWPGPEVAKWQRLMTFLGPRAHVEEFPSNRQTSGGGFLPMVCATDAGGIRFVYKFSAQLDLMRESMWTAALGNIIEPVRQHADSGYLPHMQSCPNALLYSIMSGMWID